MGSVWQALAYGFAGLRPRGDALAVDPRLPDAWPSLGIGVQFRGVPIRLVLEHESILASAPAPFTLVVDGRRVRCHAGETRVLYTGTPGET